MKRIIRFSRFFLPAAVISVLIAVTGISGYIAKGGFNLGIDFRAGLIQELQFAPTAFSLTWSGRGNARLSFDRNGLYIVISGAGVEGRTYSFPYAEYRTLGALAQGFGFQVEGLNINLNARPEVDSRWLVFSTQGNSSLGSSPYAVHYLDPQSEPISVAQVRVALTSLGQAVSVQNMGQPSDRHFMIRIEDRNNEEVSGVPVEQIVSVLEGGFGSGEIAVLRSDYVGSRFSKDLTDQAGILLALTLLLILIYASIRFKPQYAFGAVIAIIHDALVIVAFIVWTRMEFTTTTIAAILTILGYSINDTIVVFDRIRENRRIRPDDVFVDVLNRALTETLSRTIITTVTTMLAVIFLFIFSSGSMRDFALALLVGMVSGVFSTIFIASGFLNFWETQKNRREKRKLMGAPAGAKA
ncbi:MAG: protein translocase subunit SecF [Treponema sp.]|jgi:preprotein translocase subunit SecF|nr:protein translocase subunit SecF [Treponema sp.]